MARSGAEPGAEDQYSPLGSVAEAAARQAHAPTLFLREDQRGFVDRETGAISLQTILLPIDGAVAYQGACRWVAAFERLAGSSARIHPLHVGTSTPANASEFEGTIDVREGPVIETIIAHGGSPRPIRRVTRQRHRARAAPSALSGVGGSGNVNWLNAERHLGNSSENCRAGSLVKVPVISWRVRRAASWTAASTAASSPRKDDDARGASIPKTSGRPRQKRCQSRPATLSAPLIKQRRAVYARILTAGNTWSSPQPHRRQVARPHNVHNQFQELGWVAGAFWVLRQFGCLDNRRLPETFPEPIVRVLVNPLLGFVFRTKSANLFRRPVGPLDEHIPSRGVF